ncbi:HTH domain-containing protein [Alloactinosynnema sp. L-07]|uniref:HTH domain-containing protein n=1 Tax=Alloactinosynnema sp. L-07 TaxID=1653480 RepID=UPI0012F7E993|nr:HTH domain-containing protein [Alloactinosynnema sp. L-07]
MAPGALRGMVEDYLRDNSGEFSPNAIGKALNRSSGAVHNALEKLVESGYAVRTSDKPKKYSLAATTATSV